MPGGDRVGEAYVDIHVNAGPGEAELAAFKAKVDRDFAELARKKAEASLQLKSTEFDAKIEKAKTELDNLEHRKARASVALDKGKFDAEIAEAKAEIKALGREKAKVRIDLSQLRDANRETRLLTKGRELDERAALGQARAERKISQERERATREVQRAGQVEARARALNAKYDAERTASAIKNRAEVARLSAEYEKLRGRQIGLEKSSRGVFSSRSIATADKEARRLERVASEADYVKHKIEALGGSVDNLDPAIQRNHTLWGRWLGRLGDTSIRLGPITTSIKGLGTGMALLGPLIFELGGGLTSLVGTMGEGLVGAATVGAGALAGLVTSAAGVGFVIGPMIGEFKEVSAAATTLHKAELKYGKGSEQAKTAQERLNNELKGVSPIAKEAFQSYGGLKDRWRDLTKAARPAVFTAFGESLKTVQSLLPGFASESVKTTQVAGKAWDGWMKSLRSPEAKQLLGSIMSDFRASIPGLSSGLGSLVAMLGRLSAAGAHFLPGLSNGFAEWADNLERAVGGGNKLQGDVGGMVRQMQDFGHLTQHTGSLLVHIFDASATSGDGLVKSLDSVIQRWDKWTQTASGKRGLNEFFDDSKTATEDFMSSLGHLTRLLFEFSRATAPVANGLLQVVTWIGDLVSAADDLVGVKQVFQGLGIALAGLWVTSKVVAFTGAIQGAASALYGLAAGEEAVAAAQASGGIGGALFGRGKKVSTVATAGEDAAKSARQLALFGGAAGAAEAAAGGAARGAGLLALALAPEVLIPAAAVAGLTGLVLLLKQDRRSLEDVRQEAKKAGAQLATAMDESAAHVDKYIGAQHRATAANQSAADARKHLVKLQRENAPANKVTKAVEELDAAERKQTATARATAVVNRQQVQDQHRTVATAKATIATNKELVHGLSVRLRNEKEMNAQLAGGGNWRETEEELTAARKGLAAATGDLAAAQKQEAVTAIPYERQKKHLVQITQQTEQGLRKLVGTVGKAATKKIGNFVDPKDVERVTTLGNKLTKLGRGGEVKNIAVKSQGADQTIAKLQRLQKQTNRVEVARATVKVGVNEGGASNKLKGLSRLSQKLNGTQSTVKILANADNAAQAARRIEASLRRLASTKYQAEIGAIDKTKPGWQAAYHHLREIASGRYEARIGAIDDASSKAKTAERAVIKVQGATVKIPITATNEQALASIHQTEAAINAISSNVHPAPVIVPVTFKATNSPPSGRYAGGPGAYIAPFAVGGAPNARELQRAAERAQMKEAGPSRKITRPTMLVGEQAPQHPEYVIATNPAFRASNKQYLEDAAGDLGYEVIPAYKKGKGKSKKSGGSKKGAPSAAEKQANTLAHHPPKPTHHKHKIAKVEKWGPVAAYNQAETDAQIKEEAYQRLYEHDESEIKAGRMDQWEFPRMKGLLSDEAADYRKLMSLVPDIKNTVNKELGHIHGLIDGKGEFSKKTIRGVNRQVSKEKAKLSKLKQGKNESDAAFRKRKRPFENTITSLETEQHKKEKERERLIEIRSEAKQELSEVSGAKKLNEVKTNAERAEDDLQYVNDVETGVVEAPYAEDEQEEKLIEESEEFKRAKADLVAAGVVGDVKGEEAARQRMIEITEREYAEAKTLTASPEDDIDIGERLKQLKEEASSNGGKGTIGEQTSSLNEARQQLYSQFGSNIFVPTGMNLGAPGGDQQAYILTADALGQAPKPNYLPGASTMGARSAGEAALPAGGAAGKVTNVNNYFAAPPPDPHTWTKQTEFELGALA